MQILRGHPRGDLQRCTSGKKGICAEFRIPVRVLRIREVLVVIRQNFGPQEVVYDLLELGLLEPLFASGRAVAEEKGAAYGFTRERFGFALARSVSILKVAGIVRAFAFGNPFGGRTRRLYLSNHGFDIWPGVLVDLVNILRGREISDDDTAILF